MISSPPQPPKPNVPVRAALRKAATPDGMADQLSIGVHLERRGWAVRSLDDGAWRVTAEGLDHLAKLESVTAPTPERPRPANPRWALSALRSACVYVAAQSDLEAWLDPGRRTALERRGFMRMTADGRWSVTPAGRRELARLERLRRGGKLSR